jgi:hypothetical protein
MSQDRPISHFESAVLHLAIEKNISISEAIAILLKEQHER